VLSRRSVFFQFLCLNLKKLLAQVSKKVHPNPKFEFLFEVPLNSHSVRENFPRWYAFSQKYLSSVTFNYTLLFFFFGTLLLREQDCLAKSVQKLSLLGFFEMLFRNLLPKIFYLSRLAPHFKNRPYLASKGLVMYWVTSFECYLISPCLQNVFNQISLVFLIKLANSVILLPK